MSNLNVDNVKTDINNVKNYFFSDKDSLSLFNQLRRDFTAYNLMIKLQSTNQNIQSLRLKYQGDISNIKGTNGIQKLLSIESNIDSSSLIPDIEILKSQIDSLKNNMSDKISNNKLRSNVLKNNFKELYNKQYISNVQLFFGISILGFLIAKSLLNETKQ